MGQIDLDADEPPRMACPECGSVLPDIAAWFDALREQNHAVKSEIAKKLIRINKLQAEIDGQMKASKFYSKAMEVLTYWQEKCHPNARELEGERMKCVIARLSGRPKPYTVDELKRCVDGYAFMAYVVSGRGRTTHGTPAQRKVDPSLIMGDPQHVESGLAYADEFDARQQTLPNIPTPEDHRKLSELGQAAVTIANFGWHVFPIAPKAKVPVTANGLKDATRDVDRIIKFWLTHPDHNIGIRCGVESQIVVLDVDGDEGNESLRALERQHGTLPPTLSVVTPRGGQHLYFRWVEGLKNTTGFPGIGLDFRASGGYVLSPPSIGPNGRRYEVDERIPVADMPRWLVSALLERQSAQERIDPSQWEQIVSQGVSEGERDNQMTRLCGYLWHKHEPAMVLGLMLSVNAARCSPPLAQKDIKRIVDSIGRREARKRKQATEAAIQSAPA